VIGGMLDVAIVALMAIVPLRANEVWSVWVLAEVSCVELVMLVVPTLRAEMLLWGCGDAKRLGIVLPTQSVGTI
jgi:hypothetical protein